jgi:putative CRISPR-associated protein (TIGR02619 family)
MTLDHTTPMLLVSTCGTSIFTNEACPEDRAWLAKIANKKQLDKNELSRLQGIVAARKGLILEANEEKRRQLSAELNGIAAVQNRWKENRMEHYLIHSDTAIGKASAEIVQNSIQQSNVQLLSTGGLCTDDAPSFRTAMSDLTSQLIEEMLPGYRGKGYRVIFNLTGGFKSVNAYLQAVGMLYADHCVFLFESASDLMEIPRLPVELRVTDALRKFLVSFRKMAVGYPVLEQDVSDIPETLLMIADGQATPSIWGDIIWQQDKKQLLGEKLFEPLSPKIQLSDSFRKSVEALLPDRRFHVNEALDELSAYLDQGRPLLKSRAFKALEGNPCPPSTHELYLWSDGNASRAFGHYQDAIFVFDSMDAHL